MHSAFTDALVLRLTPFREADSVVQLFTPDSGVLSFMARGARKSRRRFGGVLDYLCLLRAEIRPSRQGMGTLLGVELVRSFERVRGDVARYFVGCRFLEVTRRGTREGDPAPALFALLVGALETLDGDAHPPSLSRVFDVKALAALGYGLPLVECPACGGTFDQAAVARGEVTCLPCAPSGTPPLSAGALQTLRAAARVPLDRLGSLRFTSQTETEAGPLLDAAVAAALGVPSGTPACAAAPGLDPTLAPLPDFGDTTGLPSRRRGMPAP